MMEMLSDPTVKAGIALLILIVLAAAAFFLVSRLRDYTTEDWDPSGETLSNLEEMRLKGDISEEEFRTIQAATRARVSDANDQATSDASENSDCAN